MTSKHLRRAGLILAVTLAVSAAVPVAAEPPVWSGGWLDAVAGRFAAWWPAAWGGGSAIAGSVAAASESPPPVDPNDAQPEPDGSSVGGDAPVSAQPHAEGEAAPRLDPDG